MFEFAQFATAFATLFVIIDPIGLSPMFVGLTQGMSLQRRRQITIRACLTGLVVLTLFGLTGDKLLTAIGISMPAFQIAGGLLLFLTALEMLFEMRNKRRENREDDNIEDESDDPSIFPLGIPLIAGPGAIASMILLTNQDPNSNADQIIAFGAMIAVVAMVFVMFLLASFIERVLGKTGTLVVTRVFGMLLAALAVQFILDGLRGFGIAGG